MGNLISFEERPVKAKGLNKSAKPAEEKVQQYLFHDEYQNLSLLLGLPKLEHPENPIMFYPGCGADILMPLKYIEILFPRLRNITFIFNDIDNTLGLIKTVLDDVGVSFESKKNSLQFYWNSILIDLQFLHENVFTLKDLPAFDIYFERAFRIMKDDHPEYENWIYQKLNPNGILISDSGFQHLPLEKIEISQELSAYKEMIIGVKKK
ncbi:hypothetical protein HYV87_02285 [Candidatus Woesearchaeota archaeon]|nr:hypothetical protein [Candidatus Woesearchaeota archaeon]